jgi:drug/metabolite transporter (DMT)-like permease
MVIFGGVAVETHNEILTLSDNDMIGIALSFVTAFFTAMYLIIVKSASSNSESLIMIQLMSGLMYCIPSVVFQESWNLMWDLDQHGWIMFGCFALSYLIGVSCNIYAIGKIGAATVSSLLSWRIVVSVVASWLILNETFTSLWQYVGSGIVVIAVTGTFASKRLDPIAKSKSK